MSSIPTTLTPKQAQEITDLLLLARKHLRDAQSPAKLYEPNYASTVSRIADALEKLGIEFE